MNRLHNYVPEILAIGEANHASWDVATDMFLSNVRQGSAHYNGANIDFATLKQYYNELVDSYHDFFVDYKENEIKIWDFCREEDYEVLRDFMMSLPKRMQEIEAPV